MSELMVDVLLQFIIEDDDFSMEMKSIAKQLLRSNVSADTKLEMIQSYVDIKRIKDNK